MSAETMPLLLKASLKQQHLPTIYAEWEKLALEAATKVEPHENCLLRLTEAEVKKHSANALSARIWSDSTQLLVLREDGRQRCD